MAKTENSAITPSSPGTTTIMPPQARPPWEWVLQAQQRRGFRGPGMTLRKGSENGAREEIDNLLYLLYLLEGW